MKLAIVCFVISVFMFAASVSSAGLIVSDVTASEIVPGGEALMTIGIENTFDKDIEDVSFSLNFKDLPLSVVGSSENTIEEIEEDDSEDITFRIRASTTAKPGDYQIPFSLTYKNSTQTKTGSIGVRIKGTVELSASMTTDIPVIGREDRISVKIINKGFADARYVTVTLVPVEFTVNSDKIIYIGDISANDFETATFNVRYTDLKPIASVNIEYRDFNNALQTIRLQEQLEVYTEKEAVERGIVKKNMTPIYLGIIALVIVLWIIWRMVRRRRRLKKSMQAAGQHA